MGGWMQQADFLQHGWARFAHDPELDDWARAIRPIGISLAEDPDLRSDWLRHGGTWFAGVNVLPNSKSGALGQSGALRGQAVDFIAKLHPEYRVYWDQGQISVCYPGYPMPDDGETREFHGFVLGVPLTSADAKAAPLVVWDKSHEIMRLALRGALSAHAQENWSEIDLTEVYQAARREVFDTCKRVELSVRPGEATLLHRFTLHGVAPWEEGAQAEPSGRMIAYFRPCFAWSAGESLAAP